MKFTENYQEICSYILENENLLEGIRPTVKNLDGTIPIIKAYRRGQEKIEFLDLLTIEPAPEQHIDILSCNCTLTFKLSSTPIAVDRFVFLGYYNQEIPVDYTVREFKLYFSNNEDDLFDEANLAYAHRNFDGWEGASNDRTGKHVDAMLTFEPLKVKYFGIKFSEPNPTDDILRIGHIALHSKEHDETVGFIKKYFSRNLLSPELIKIEGYYEGHKPSLCDSIAFNGEGIKVSNNRIIIKERAVYDCTHLYVTANEKDALTINGNTPTCLSAPRGEYLYYCNYDGSEKAVIEITKPTLITEIGLNQGVRRFEVTDKVITENFYGVGTNTIPSLFMAPGLNHGMNDALWEEEKRRTKLSPPSVARLWFQPDWFIIDEESYFKHEYNFDSDEMKSVYKYLDLYLECGTEIEFNCGWKVDERVWDWYCLDEVVKKRESVPKNVAEFAYSCAAVLKELIENRGYTNIKYLTFYNEPNWTFPDEGDFVVSGPIDRSKINTATYRNQPKMDYWIDMLRQTKAALNKVGLDYIKLWGPETSCGDNQKIYWAEEFQKVSDILDVHTTHRYSLSADECEAFCEFMLEAAKKPLILTEFGCFNQWRSWHRNVVEMIISYSRAGASGMLHWLQSGTYVPGYEDFYLSGIECQWDTICLTPDKVNNYFYHYCLFNRYIPSHSKVLYSTAFSPDTRVVAYETSKGDTVIAVESKAINSTREINISLPNSKEKVFSRFTVLYDNDTNTHAHLPYCDKKIAATDTLVDTINEGYSLTFYTTEKPQEQITCDVGYKELAVGESMDITYTLHDTEAKNVSFEIVIGEDVVSLNGNKVIAKANGTAAIKVILTDAKTECYDIVLVKV